ncbi:RsmD family RNA methyltransferase [Candidatus Saccharibacteria bacterium]|nr:RsmD family RNA methyltransferase [Candidatus Saccharibacteria bacterium]MCB9821593.1 RsmD family RNA methyltransferase [Candidatus Nomurabacteria bacterium]
MRIIGGKLKSRIFKAPPGKRTHPMGEKPRGAIFNALGDLTGMTVLDAYAGSGALSFEAISRGASSATALDIDKKAYITLTENILLLGLEKEVHASRANCSTWVKNNQDLSYDIVFADPPYYDLNPKHIEELATAVKSEGLLVISHGAFYRPNFNEQGWQLLSHKQYANANISIYKKP